ncbi:MAG: hypothetical protein U0929_20235 [Planctomycetaceae bacterium]
MRDIDTVTSGLRTSGQSPLKGIVSVMGAMRKFFCVLCLLLGLAAPAFALEVREVRWGFNNAVKRDSFNLCSIDLINPSSEAFQGPIQLMPEGSLTRGGDTPWVDRNFYIGPGETRTVQFVPFVAPYDDEWSVVWGGGQQERYTAPVVNRSVSRQVTVQFQAAQGISAPISGIEVFREEDFPIGASGIEVLGGVVLDHVPQRWDAVRTRAFRDWLGRGGRLYLIQGRDGKPLDFPASLSELNFPGDRFSVGQGVVTRHPIAKDAGEIPGLVNEVSTSIVDPNSQNFGYDVANDPANEAAKQILETMRAMIRPNHDWALIFFLAIIYLLILFPGIWIFSRKRGDFRITYALILGTVVVFSWLYAEIGKRGYGESTGLREVMVAYPLGNQRLALQKYCSLFVTEGGQYPIQAEGEGAVQTLDEGFSGRVGIGLINRPQAGFTPDIPPYSSCSFRELTVLPTQGDYSMQVKTLEAGAELKKLEVVLGAGVPATAQVYFVSNDEVYSLTHNGTHWQSSTQAMPISSMFNYERAYYWRQLTPQEFEKNLVSSLVQAVTRYSVIDSYDTTGGESPADPAEDKPSTFEGGQLLVYCDAPAELLPSQYSPSGKVMFVSNIDSSMVTASTSP